MLGFLSFKKHQAFSVIASVVLTLLVVYFTVHGVTYIDTDSVGIATATPGAALSVKGEAIVEGFLSIDYLFSTSTSHASGFGTSSPGAEFGVAGAGLFDGILTASALYATTTNATSTLEGGLNLATSSMIVDNYSGRMAIGTTSVPDADIVAGQATDPGLTISGLGSAQNATGTLYITGEGATGGAILLKSGDGQGSRCISITATAGANDVGGSGADATSLLNVKVVSCPE